MGRCVTKLSRKWRINNNVIAALATTYILSDVNANTVNPISPVCATATAKIAGAIVASTVDRSEGVNNCEVDDVIRVRGGGGIGEVVWIEGTEVIRNEV